MILWLQNHNTGLHNPEIPIEDCMITGFCGGSSIAGYHVVSVSIESCDSGYSEIIQSWDYNWSFTCTNDSEILGLKDSGNVKSPDSKMQGFQDYESARWGDSRI